MKIIYVVCSTVEAARARAQKDYLMILSSDLQLDTVRLQWDKSNNLIRYRETDYHYVSVRQVLRSFDGVCLDKFELDSTVSLEKEETIKRLIFGLKRAQLGGKIKWNH